MSTLLLPPTAIEPLRKNRFLVVLPKELDIHPFLVRSVILPKTEVIDTYESSYFSRIRMVGRVDISDCIMKIMPTCGDGILKKLFEHQTTNTGERKYKGFDFSVQMLDPIGMVVEEYKMLGCILKEIKVETLDYADDQPINYEIIIAVSHYIIE